MSGRTVAALIPGDILATIRKGHPRFVCVADREWERVDDYQVRVYVHDCDSTGRLNGRNRWLLKSTLASRYRLHCAAEDVIR